MNAIQSTTAPRLARASRLLAGLLLALTFVACDGLTGPGAEEPEPQFSSVYDLNLTTRYIKVQGSCDPNDLFGNPTHGEFQYKYIVSGEGQRHTRSSDRYNSVTGESFRRKAGELINFANRTYTWRTLSRPVHIDVKLHGAEWDGPVKDRDMQDRSGSKAVPFELGKHERMVVIGAEADCQIRLVYDAEWTERVVQD